MQAGGCVCTYIFVCTYIRRFTHIHRHAFLYIHTHTRIYMYFMYHWLAEWNLKMGRNQCEQRSVDPLQFFYYYSQIFRTYSGNFPKTCMEFMHPLHSLTFIGVQRINSIKLHGKIPLLGFIQGCSSKEIPVVSLIMSWPRCKSLQSSTTAHACQQRLKHDLGSVFH